MIKIMIAVFVVVVGLIAFSKFKINTGLGANHHSKEQSKAIEK